MKSTGATIRLVPGTPYDGLARSANALGKIDVLVLSPGGDPEQMDAAWFFIPRLLNDHSLIFLETAGAGEEASFRLVPDGALAGWPPPCGVRRKVLAWSSD